MYYFRFGFYYEHPILGCEELFVGVSDTIGNNEACALPEGASIKL